MIAEKLKLWFKKNGKDTAQTYPVCPDQHCSPLDAYYDGFSGELLEIPLSKSRSHIMGFKPDNSPFFDTLKGYQQGQVEYKGSVLERYYSEFQPKTMADVLSINSPKLKKFHAMATVMPWSNITPEQRFARFCINPDQVDGRFLSKEGLEHGLNPELDYGCQYFGPISQAHGELEFNRLISVYQQISNTGFQPENHGYMHGEFLIDNQDWVWIAIGGKHRFAALSALEIKRIPIANKARWSAMFIRRSEVNFWPNVRNGLFTPDQALEVFDRTMHGRSR